MHILSTRTIDGVETNVLSWQRCCLPLDQPVDHEYIRNQWGAGRLSP